MPTSGSPWPDLAKAAGSLVVFWIGLRLIWGDQHKLNRRAWLIHFGMLALGGAFIWVSFRFFYPGWRGLVFMGPGLTLCLLFLFFPDVSYSLERALSRRRE
jgi:hypothetical protein